MKKILILKGLPASGKTTFAKDLCKKGWVRINKDDLRGMINDGIWSRRNENYILKFRNSLILEALKHNDSIVVDDTNLNDKHEKEIRELVSKEPFIEVEVKFFDTPLEICIERDKCRAKPVGEKVIREMAAQYLKIETKPFPSGDKWPSAVLCDIDGTLAHMNGRSPFDWSKVDTDEPDLLVIELLDYFSQKNHIILMSGRDEGQCREKTEEWLKRYAIPYGKLFMRPAGDSRRDDIVKEELLNAHVRGQFNVKLVLDDRDRVVQMWRKLGLKCFQVANGNF